MDSLPQDGGPAAPLAVIGLAFEFPQGATSDEAFWQMLYEGRSASTDFPRSRLDIDAFYHPDKDRPSSIPLRGGHFVDDDLAAFDAPFFSISAAEAACMDPQHRRMLETAYHALEDAGIPLGAFAGSDTAVYTGSFTNDYLALQQHDLQAERRHGAMGVAASMMANRLSWFFDLKGTSFNVDSACSSSLLALHLACQDLRAGNSSMALVGGANLVFHPGFMKLMSDANFLSVDGRCWSFDDRANGYARGEGIAVVLIKPLAHALRDGDTVRAVIRNTGSNQDGRTPGITQPNRQSQIDLIRKTYQQAGVDMGPTRFFEAHATATPVGDPIEAGAIGASFRQHRSSSSPMHVGAVKANIGHLESCSGLAGLIKTILVLERGVIPPIAGLQILNRQIDAENLHLHFPTKPVPWPPGDVRRACINSFGFGGTNVVAILDDASHHSRDKSLHGFHRTEGKFSASQNGHAEPRTPSLISESTLNGFYPSDEPATRPSLLIWSAPDRAGAERLSHAYDDYIRRIDSLKLRNLAYALAVKRTLFPWRSFTVAYPSSSNGDPGPPLFAKPTKATSRTGVAFVFTGQGAQYLGMGRRLLSFPVFRDSLGRCEDCLRLFGCPWSLLDVVNGANDQIKMDQADISQPSTTCLQIALVDMLRDLGISPSMVTGHSSGEIAAAYCTGALSRSSAVKIAYYRGLLCSRLAAEVDDLAMLAVGLSKDQILPYLKCLHNVDNAVDVEIGCVNSPKNITLTGSASQLAALEDCLKRENIFARRLRVPLAYHSRFMTAIADRYAASIVGLEGADRPASSAPMVSSVTGDVVAPHILATAEYWVRNLTSPVEFASAFNKVLAFATRTSRKRLGRGTLVDPQLSHVLEIGPHSALESSIRENLLSMEGVTKPAYMASLVRGQDGSVTLLRAAAALFCAGHPVDLMRANGLHGDTRRQAPADMPRYPFNHQQKYWAESTLSSNFRFPGASRHDLFGARSPDWNPQVAQWRNVLRVAEVPWLEDHRIAGEIVFPAAGFVVMAIEALRQLLADTEPVLRGVIIHDVVFVHPIRILRGTPHVETQLTLSSQPHHLTRDTPSWTEFRIFVLDNGSYLECSRGFIRPIFDVEDQDRMVALGPWASETWRDRVSSACRRSVEDPYEMPKENAVSYGPAFRCLENVCLGDQGEAMANINTGAWKSSGSVSASPDYGVHPTVMDGLAQLVVPAVSQLRDNVQTMVPVRVNRIWLDLSRDDSRQGKITVRGECRLRGHRGAYANLVGTGPASGSPFIYLDGLETTFIDNGQEKSIGQITVEPRKLCTHITWEPDIDFMSRQQLQVHCTRNRPPQRDGAVEAYKSLTLAIMAFIHEAVFRIDNPTPLVHLDRHLEAFAGWMGFQLQRLHRGDMLVDYDAVLTLLRDSDARWRLVSQVEDSGIDGLFFMQIGRNLGQILCGKVDPLGLMFENGLVDRYYEEMLANEHHAHPASAYVDLLCFKNPSMKIIEVGAGTGGQTLRLLEKMSSDGVQKWARYDYTDISPSFFGQARLKLQAYGSRLDFRVCDISQDPVGQSFEAGAYDLVVASHVLHATNLLDESLRNVRKLLKPGGKLFLFETTSPDAILAFAFGLLKGWWSPLDHEIRSPFSPCLSVEQWDDRLKRTGFSGIDLEIPGQAEPQTRYSSFIVSTALHPSTIGRASTPQEFTVVADGCSRAQKDIANRLKTELSSDGRSCVVIELSHYSSIKSARLGTVIFLLEVDSVFLDGMSEFEYLSMRSVMVRETSTLWVTRPPVPGATEPRHGLADGLGRVLMSEDASRKFVTLSLDGWDQDSTYATLLISQLAERIAESPVEGLETKYTTLDGVLQIGRVRKDASMDSRIAKTLEPREKRQTRVVTDSSRLSLEIGMPGNLETLEWTEDESVYGEPALNDDEVLVRVRAVGLTDRDYLVASGQLDDRDLGIECAGEVQAAGKNSGFRYGDRVCLIATSTSRSTIRAKGETMVSIPSHWTFSEACSLASAAWTAHHALVNIARLREGESVLIHRAAKSEGQMAIQLARELGAQVFVSVGSASEQELLRERLQIPDSNIFLISQGLSLLSEISRTTKTLGVDAIVGPLALDVDKIAFAECLAPLGRLIDTCTCPRQTRADQAPVPHPTNVLVASVDMIDLLRKRPDLAYSSFRSAMEAAFGAPLQAPHPLDLFTANEVHTAFRQGHDDRTGVSKRVIELNPDVSVTANFRTRPRYSFEAEATYVISGGLGGLGRSFARWMVSRGAKNLILMSRSGASTASARALVHELISRDVHVETPKVDVGNLAEVQEMVRAFGSTMPPIRGCIQASVVLRDNLFPNMTYEDWVISTKAKVAGSWNLHAALPRDLDFFILISSLNGIMGGRGQANYGAGNAFEDALAQHRVLSGQKAVSIDLGLMVAEGIVAENPQLLASMRRIGHLMDIRREELLALLDHYCDPDLPVLDPADAQILVGLELPDAVLAKGIDLHHSIRRPLFRHLFQMGRGQSGGDESGASSVTAGLDRASMLASADSQAAAAALVVAWLAGKIGQILGLAEEDVDVARPAHTYSIDSLVAIDLKNWFSREIGADMEIFTLLGNASLEQLAEQAAAKSRYRQQAEA
ncbi:hypothetical protein CDD83_9906 [Cordyceps sp. RAO-2017]|nr:hypothetical protein CDD83_9906 [Cordyceps sp. RAO-2017]